MCRQKLITNGSGRNCTWPKPNQRKQMKETCSTMSMWLYLGPLWATNMPRSALSFPVTSSNVQVFMSRKSGFPTLSSNLATESRLGLSSMLTMTKICKKYDRQNAPFLAFRASHEGCLLTRVPVCHSKLGKNWVVCMLTSSRNHNADLQGHMFKTWNERFSCVPLHIPKPAGVYHKSRSFISISCRFWCLSWPSLSYNPHAWPARNCTWTPAETDRGPTAGESAGKKLNGANW